MHRGQAGRMMGFLAILLLVVGAVSLASWFYRERIAASDTSGVGAIVLLLMVLALLIVVMVGAARMAAGR